MLKMTSVTFEFVLGELVTLAVMLTMFPCAGPAGWVTLSVLALGGLVSVTVKLVSMLRLILLVVSFAMIVTLYNPAMSYSGCT